MSPDILKGGLIDVAQAAKLMGVSASTIYRMIDEGLLPAIRIRRAIKVPRRAVEQYIQKQLERL